LLKNIGLSKKEKKLSVVISNAFLKQSYLITVACESSDIYLKILGSDEEYVSGPVYI